MGSLLYLRSRYQYIKQLSLKFPPGDITEINKYLCASAFFFPSHESNTHHMLYALNDTNLCASKIKMEIKDLKFI